MTAFDLMMAEWSKSKSSKEYVFAYFQTPVVSSGLEASRRSTCALGDSPNHRYAFATAWSMPTLQIADNRNPHGMPPDELL